MCNQGSSCCWIIVAIIILFLLCGNGCAGNWGGSGSNNCGCGC